MDVILQSNHVSAGERDVVALATVNKHENARTIFLTTTTTSHCFDTRA